VRKRLIRYGVKVGGKLLCLDADFADPVSVDLNDMGRLITPSIRVAKKRLREFQQDHDTRAGRVCVVAFSVSVS